MTDLSDYQPTRLQPPEEITHGLFSRSRELARTHPLATDALAAAVLLILSTIWLLGSPFSSVRAGVIQAALIGTLVARRVNPCLVFALTCALALTQWFLGFPLFGDAALLVALYTVAVHESRRRAFLATAVLEVGAVMAAIKFDPAHAVFWSFLFLSAMVIAALFGGLTVASGSRYLEWMDERARRLEIERDQQAMIAAAAERTRIARELHDIVSHSLSVVITLADAAAVVTRTDPNRGGEAMSEVSEVGRHALSDMRAMLGVLRTDEQSATLAPQPGMGQLAELIERVRGTGLAVHVTVDGMPAALGAATELSVFRIVQEALTNTLHHAAAHHAWVTLRFDGHEVEVRVVDDGSAAPSRGPAGHGVAGMRERAALHGGALNAGPNPGGGWMVSTTLQLDGAASAPLTMASG